MERMTSPPFGLKGGQAGAAAVVDAELEAAATTVPAAEAATLIGVAGTVTTLGALHLALADGDAPKPSQRRRRPVEPDLFRLPLFEEKK